MSVLIKGLEMPETEYMDVRIFRDGTAVIASGKKPYYKEFEAVDVPTPHGSLIDADALERDGWRMHRIVRIDEKTMESQTRKPTDFPVVDVEPVRHGKWILFSPRSLFYSCSLCGQWSDRIWNYCPACGARMDEE